MIVQQHRICRRSKHHAAGHEILRGRVGEIFSLGDSLRDGDILGRFNELGELRVGDFGLVHPKAIDSHAYQWPRVVHRIWSTTWKGARVETSHRVLTTRNPNHPFGHSRWSWTWIDRSWSEFIGFEFRRLLNGLL
jgi:hypothetical protein